MSKPENSFIARVHRLLPASLHREKMNNMYRRGTWDVWYSGHKADLWVEYKYLEKIPERANMRPELTPLQIEWGRRRFEEGRNLAVIVGTKDGGVLYAAPSNSECTGWEDTNSPNTFGNRIVHTTCLAVWIRVHCEGA